MQVYRHPYQQKFQLDFTISLGGGHEEVVTDPVSLMEVNGRTSFTITGQGIAIHCTCNVACINGRKMYFDNRSEE